MTPSTDSYISLAALLGLQTGLPYLKTILTRCLEETALRTNNRPVNPEPVRAAFDGEVGVLGVFEEMRAIGFGIRFFTERVACAAFLAS